MTKEVRKWLRQLSPGDLRRAERRLDQLATNGPELSMPHARQLDKNLYELRFTASNVEQRVTYTFEPERRVITLTQFRKQRQRETRHVQRAREVARDWHRQRAHFEQRGGKDPLDDTTRWRPKP
nr:type II toxin-antitoxin system RelE/ParE family toxin [Helcobacillus sp. ACRRO]